VYSGRIKSNSNLTICAKAYHGNTSEHHLTDAKALALCSSSIQLNSCQDATIIVQTAETAAAFQKEGRPVAEKVSLPHE